MPNKPNTKLKKSPIHSRDSPQPKDQIPSFPWRSLLLTLISCENQHTHFSVASFSLQSRARTMTFFSSFFQFFFRLPSFLRFFLPQLGRNWYNLRRIRLVYARIWTVSADISWYQRQGPIMPDAICVSVIPIRFEWFKLLVFDFISLSANFGTIQPVCIRIGRYFDHAS